MSARSAATSRPARLALAALAIGLGVQLASCSANPSVPTTNPPGTPTPSAPSPEPTVTPTATPTAAPTTAPTPSPTAPIVTADEPICASSQVQIAFSQSLSEGAAGSFTMALGIWNRGARACKLRGWATIQFLNADGGLVPTNWLETTGDFSGSAQPVAVSLLPCAGSGGCTAGATPAAYISVAGDHAIAPCVTAARVRVFLPGSSRAVIGQSAGRRTRGRRGLLL